MSDAAFEMAPEKGRAVQRDQAAPLRLCGERVMADPAGALYWPREKMLIVADLHFEKGSHFAGRGTLLPPYDTRATLGRLERLCRTYDPRVVVSLGDSFHDGEAEARLSPQDRDHLAALGRRVHWIWVTGNHDPAPPISLGGEAVAELDLKPFLFRHEPQPAPATGEIAGHLHPCGAVTVRGRRLRRRCFVSDGTRLILPAFGAYTGGLNVLDEAFAGLFGASFHAWLMGRDGIYPVAARSLRPD